MPMSVELDFPNCNAFADSTDTYVKSMTVTWNPYSSAAGYKVFFKYMSHHDLDSNSGVNADPTGPLLGTSLLSFDDSTNIITSTSVTHNFIPIADKTLYSISAYVYAYDSLGNRITSFPQTKITAATSKPTLGSTVRTLVKLLYYDNTIVLDSSYTSQFINPLVTQENISTKAFIPTPTSTPICFLASAPVLTPSGYRRIDQLAVGDLVSTPQGTAPIKSIHKKFYEASSSTNPYLIPKGLFGATEDLEISPRHKIAFKGQMIEARNLGLKKVKHTGTLTYYNLELNNENMIVAGVEVESLKPLVRVTITQEAFKQILQTQYGGKMTDEIKSKCQLLPDGRVSVPSIKH